MNGGAWLTVADLPVDVLFRDLDTIEPWHQDAEHGSLEILTQSGGLGGAPTYVPVGELAICHRIIGDLPRPAFPTALARNAQVRWQGRASVSLMFAKASAQLADAICCTGMLANAVLLRQPCPTRPTSRMDDQRKHLV